MGVNRLFCIRFKLADACGGSRIPHRLSRHQHFVGDLVAMFMQDYLYPHHGVYAWYAFGYIRSARSGHEYCCEPAIRVSGQQTYPDH